MNAPQHERRKSNAEHEGNELVEGYIHKEKTRPPLAGAGLMLLAGAAANLPDDARDDGEHHHRQNEVLHRGVGGLGISEERGEGGRDGSEQAEHDFSFVGCLVFEANAPQKSNGIAPK